MDKYSERDKQQLEIIRERLSYLHNTIYHKERYEIRDDKHDEGLSRIYFFSKIIVTILIGGWTLFLLEVSAAKYYGNHNENFEKVKRIEIQNNKPIKDPTIKEMSYKEIKEKWERTKSVERIVLRNQMSCNC